MTQWNRQHKQDHYYKQAKKHGYRARSSFKLIQIHKRYGIFKQGDIVIDLGASPGGWSQIASKYAERVVAIDLVPFEPIEKVDFIYGDITKKETLEKISGYVTKADVVLSDASPNISGHYSMDQARSIWLCENALTIALQFLKTNGTFLCKIFEGEDYNEFLNEVKANFNMVKPHAPKATRKKSSEKYIVAKGFKLNKGLKN